MANAPTPRVARIDQREFADLLAGGTDQERGRRLRLRLHYKGIDTRRLYRTEYHPDRRCWLLIQGGEAEFPAGPVEVPPPGKDDARFYRHTAAEFRRTARIAFAALAAASPHFARFGRSYHAPEPGRELTAAELAGLLGGPGDDGPTVNFDGEGGWRSDPSEN
jgi:hypothetical protein